MGIPNACTHPPSALHLRLVRTSGLGDLSANQAHYRIAPAAPSGLLLLRSSGQTVSSEELRTNSQHRSQITTSPFCLVYPLPRYELGRPLLRILVIATLLPLPPFHRHERPESSVRGAVCL